MKNFALIFLGILLLSSMVYALPTISTLWLNDTDNYVYYDKSYLMNLTISGVTNAATGNVTSCFIGGSAMTYPASPDNGTGSWSVNTTFNAMNMSGNCTYTNITASCYLYNGSRITTQNNSYIMMPCVATYTNRSQVNAVTASANTTLLVSYILPYSSLRVQTNLTPLNTTGRVYCEVYVRTDKANITTRLAYLAFNTTHEYCPYDVLEINSTAVQIRVNTVKSFGEKPDNPFTAGLIAIVIVSIGAGVGVDRLLRRGSKRS